MWDGTLLARKFLGGDVDKKTGNLLYHLATLSASNVKHLYIIYIHTKCALCDIITCIIYIHGVCCCLVFRFKGSKESAAGLCV